MSLEYAICLEHSIMNYVSAYTLPYEKARKKADKLISN